MDTPVLPFGSEYHVSKRSEYKLSTELQPIHLVFPQLTEITWARLTGHCLKVDHCKIEYNPQVPFNSTGTVMVEVHDSRMEEGHTLQAEYCFPIDCQVDLHYYSTSYFSVQDPIPWKAYYRVKDTNIRGGCYFTKMKGLLKLSAARKSYNMTFRSPTINILSPRYSLRDVDFRHVGYGHTERAVCRTNSEMSTSSAPRMIPGVSFQQDIIKGTGLNTPTDEYNSGDMNIFHRLDSDRGSSSSTIGRPSISIAPEQLGELIGRSISEAMHIFTDTTAMKLPDKPV